MLLVLLGLTIGDRPAQLAALAVNSTGGSAEPPTYVSYGALGLLVLAIITGTFRTKWEVGALERQIVQLVKENERLIAENQKHLEVNRAFSTQLTGQTLPALAQTAQVMQTKPTTEAELLEQLRRLEDRLDNLPAKGDNQ